MLNVMVEINSLGLFLCIIKYFDVMNIIMRIQGCFSVLMDLSFLRVH